VLDSRQANHGRKGARMLRYRSFRPLFAGCRQNRTRSTTAGPQVDRSIQRRGPGADSFARQLSERERINRKVVSDHIMRHESYGATKSFVKKIADEHGRPSPRSRMVTASSDARPCSALLEDSNDASRISAPLQPKFPHTKKVKPRTNIANVNVGTENDDLTL
jgi:hypothetical protein